MNIGYDGKRAFQNKTGLGNYIRSLIAILTHHYPQNFYSLFAPKQSNLFDATAFHQVAAIFPATVAGKIFPGWWRRKGMVKVIDKAGLDIYHGVSNELPLYIERTRVKTVVTVHDIIFERYPETYHFDERFVHRWKVKRACRVADAIVAISEQTKEDLIHFYGVNPEKIFICYQSCNPIFHQIISTEEKALIKKRYHLPANYFLFVGSIAPRKNLITICKAMVLLKHKLDFPLVIIGNGKKEKQQAKKLMLANGLADRLICLNEMEAATENAFTTAKDFPAIYQQANALIYPSIFEGFGIPVLEAFHSGLPVISSNTSSLPEVGGAAALYFSPTDYEMLAKHMLEVATNAELVEALKRTGRQQAEKFGTEKYAASIMKVYNHII